MLLSSQRKLAALALATLLSLDAASLPLTGEVLAYTAYPIPLLHPIPYASPAPILYYTSSTQVLSYCVGVLEDLEPTDDDAPADGSGPAPSAAPPVRAGGSEHAEFAARLAESGVEQPSALPSPRRVGNSPCPPPSFSAGLDPMGRLTLRPALKECIARCQAAHGDLFDAQLRALDPALMQQVQRSFGGGGSTGAAPVA